MRAASTLKLGAGAVGAATLGVALWWRAHPSACPYSQRFWVDLPHPIITRERLLEALVPQPGERILEIGPGTGYYALTVAKRLTPGGQLTLLDLQQEMLDHTTRRAAERGLDNMVPARGDAQDLPFEDASFDASYVILALGEIPDQDAALRELRRVLKPRGRLVVGELFGDPHWVRFGALRERAAAAGLRIERRIGGALGYFARLVPA